MNLTPLWFLAKIEFSRALQYRTAALISFATQTFWGVILEQVCKSFVADGPKQARLVAAIWIGQALLMLANPFADGRIVKSILSGDWSLELLKPMPLVGHWHSATFGRLSGAVMLRAIMCYSFALLTGRIPLPPLSHVPGIVFVLFGAIVLSSSLITLGIVFLLSVPDQRSVYSFMSAIMGLGAGLNIPLDAFPESWSWILRLLPFSGLMDSVVRAWLDGNAAWLGLKSIAWAVAILGVCQMLFHRQYKRARIAGG